MFRKIFCAGAGFALGAVALLAATKPVIKIGLILPLTGSMGSAGETFRDAARLAASEIPSTSRYRYELIFEDDALNSRKAATAANKLLFVDKVNVLISTWSYGGMVAAPLAERAKVPHFALAWDINILKHPTSFLFISPPGTFLPIFFEAFKKKGWKKIWVVGVKESGSVYCMDECVRTSKDHGITVVGREMFNYGEGGQTDFRTFLAKANAMQFDAWFVNMATPQIELFLKQKAEMGDKHPITSITGFDTTEDLKAIEGMWYVTDSYVERGFAEKFEKQYGSKKLYGVTNYYDLIRLIAHVGEAFERVPTTAEWMKGFMKGEGFTLSQGPVEFLPNRIIAYPSKLMMIRNGKRVPITMDQLP